MAESRKGVVTQVMGPVVDVRFDDEGSLPDIYNALTMPIGDKTLTVNDAAAIVNIILNK